MKYLFSILLYMEDFEKPTNPEQGPGRFSGLKSILTSLALLFGATSCNNIPNDQIIADPTSMSIAFNVEYHFFQWSAWIYIVSYYVNVDKVWDLYVWKVKQRNWPQSRTTPLKDQNLHKLFGKISKETDSEQISDETRCKKNAKLDFAEQVYKDSVLNNKNPKKGKIKIKYKK